MPGRQQEEEVGFDYGVSVHCLVPGLAHLAVCMQKRTWGCVGKLCPIIVIGHECNLSEARSEA